MDNLKRYRYASWLYYHAIGDVQSPMPDWEYDTLQQELGMIKTDAFTIKLTEDEKREALEWAEYGRLPE